MMSEDLLLFDEAGDLRPKLAAAHPKVVRSPEEAIRVVVKTLRPAVCVARWLTRKDEWQARGWAGARPRARLRLLVLNPVAVARREYLGMFFGTVIARGDDIHLLAEDELLAVLMEKDRRDLLVGAAADAEDRVMVLYRGDLTTLIVPFGAFRPSGAGERPDFTDVEVIDGGQTLRLGTYEAATSAVLYEFDPAYRRRLEDQRLRRDRSFGSSLRRLRLQRGLGRGELGLSAKEVARLERGEVKTPHMETRAVLARHLRVKPGDIERY